MSVHQAKDPANWSLTIFVRYPNLELFEEAQDKACKQGPVVPVSVKWRKALAGLPLSTPAHAWLNQAVTETFSWLLEPEYRIEPAMVHGMDSYNIFLYLAMEIGRVSALLRVSTIAKEAGLCWYADLLDQVADAKPQPAGGARTTRTPNEAIVSQEPNAGNSARLLLAASQADLLKSNWVLAEKMAIYLGRPAKAEPFLGDFKNCTRLMSDVEKIRWFAVLIRPECSKWFEQQ